VVPGNAKDRKAQRAEELTKVVVGFGAVVLDKVTGYDGEVCLPGAVAIVIEY
jgi:hypothetical protein